jgi:hypothetical protein
VIRRLLLGCVVLLTLGGCTDDGSGMSVDAVQEAAADAGSSPADCPLGIDLPAAGFGDARLESAEATASEQDEPAEDPIAAQRGGMSAIDAAAGAEIDCHYRVGDESVDVYLVATRTDNALGLFAPLIAQDADLSTDELERFLVPPPKPGEIKLVGEEVAFAVLAADGGSAAMLVSSTVPDLWGDALRSATDKLTADVSF